MSEDRQWLAEFAQTGSEAAFRQIVGRHLQLVHSAALRMVNGDAALAQDITQLVFTNLASQARSLPPDVVLAGWLHRDTRFTALEWLRKERRRVQREQQAAAMNALETAGPEADWSHLRPVLDEVLDELDDPDRHALLLRFFQQQTFAEVGAALGLTDEAARKRVDRALDGLRGALARRGVTSTAAGLALLLGAHVVVTVPTALAATVASVSLAGAATAGGLTVQLIQLMTATKLKLIAAVVIAAAVGTPLVVQHRANEALRAENTALREQTAQLEKLRAENQRLTAEVQADAARPLAEREELMRLRGQIGRFQQEMTNRNHASGTPGGQTDDLAATWPIGSLKWVPEWKDVGLDSPESAVETYWRAIASGSPDRLQQCMVFGGAGTVEPVSPIYARREARSESVQIKSGKIQAMRLCSVSHSRDLSYATPLEEAKVEIEMTGMSSLYPARADNSPGQAINTLRVGERKTIALLKVGSEWKVLGDETHIKVSPDDEEDADAVAKMMTGMSPEQVEEMKQKVQIPARTLQLYEEMKAKAAR